MHKLLRMSTEAAQSSLEVGAVGTCGRLEMRKCFAVRRGDGIPAITYQCACIILDLEGRSKNQRPCYQATERPDALAQRA